MSTERVNQDLSSDIVKHLRAKGMTLKDIGNRIGLTESYISHVHRGARAFTLKHLLMLEKSLKKPLPMLLVEVMDGKSIPKELRSGYEQLRRLLKEQPDWAK